MPSSPASPATTSLSRTVKIEESEGVQVSFKNVVNNPNHIIETRGVWEKVTLASNGCLDGRAVWLLAKILGLDGLRIVRHEDGLLIPCDAGGRSDGDRHLVLQDGYGNYKALIPLHKIPLVSPACL